MSDFREVVQVSGAYDERHADPKTNYGVGGMRIHFVLIGPRGAVQFIAALGVYLPSVIRYWQAEHSSAVDLNNPACSVGRVEGHDIGYHAFTPQYDGHKPMKGLCEYLGAPCYYDGTSLGAEEFAPEFVRGGSDAVWTELRAVYARRFGSDSLVPDGAA